MGSRSYRNSYSIYFISYWTWGALPKWQSVPPFCLEAVMKEYQLEIKQIADYPKCRIYRGFIQSLIADHRLHAGPASHLFHYTVLCCYANFRTSYLRLEGVSYTIRPGEWICRVSDLMRWFRVRFQHQVLSILEDLQNLHLITFSEIRKKCIIRYRIAGWKKYNTVLD